MIKVFFNEMNGNKIEMTFNAIDTAIMFYNAMKDTATHGSLVSHGRVINMF